MHRRGCCVPCPGDLGPRHPCRSLLTELVTLHSSVSPGTAPGKENPPDQGQHASLGRAWVVGEDKGPLSQLRARQFLGKILAQGSWAWMSFCCDFSQSLCPALLPSL